MIPAPSTENFCNFILGSVYIRLTPARKNVINETKQAAINQTPLSQNAWNNFLLSTKDFYQDYLVNKEFFTP